MIQGDGDRKEGGIEFFSAKNPDSQDIKNRITYEQAREKEAHFFSTKAPWSGLEWLYQRRLGTDNLTRRLGQVLSNLIAKRKVFTTLDSAVNWNILIGSLSWRMKLTGCWSKRIMTFLDSRVHHPQNLLGRCCD
jgi:Dynamin central region